VLWSIGTVSRLFAQFHLQIPMIPGSMHQPSKHFRFPRCGSSCDISADAAYDAREIRQYNRKRRIKSNIPANRRSWRHPKRGRPVGFDPELYKKRNAVERFFSWIEAFKKIVPRYERYEHSFLGLIYLACSVMIGRILG
jgi:transposase